MLTRSRIVADHALLSASSTSLVSICSAKLASSRHAPSSEVDGQLIRTEVVTSCGLPAFFCRAQRSLHARRPSWASSGTSRAPPPSSHAFRTRGEGQSAGERTPLAPARAQPASSSRRCTSHRSRGQRPQSPPSAILALFCRSSITSVPSLGGGFEDAVGVEECEAYDHRDRRVSDGGSNVGPELKRRNTRRRTLRDPRSSALDKEKVVGRQPPPCSLWLWRRSHRHTREGDRLIGRPERPRGSQITMNDWELHCPECGESRPFVRLDASNDFVVDEDDHRLYRPRTFGVPPSEAEPGLSS